MLVKRILIVENSRLKFFTKNCQHNSAFIWLEVLQLVGITLKIKSCFATQTSNSMNRLEKRVQIILNIKVIWWQNISEIFKLLFISDCNLWIYPNKCLHGYNVPLFISLQSHFMSFKRMKTDAQSDARFWFKILLKILDFALSATNVIIDCHTFNSILETDTKFSRWFKTIFLTHSVEIYRVF